MSSAGHYMDSNGDTPYGSRIEMEREARAMFCDHANEVPAQCPCSEDCYCKAHTCSEENIERRRQYFKGSVDTARLGPQPESEEQAIERGNQIAEIVRIAEQKLDEAKVDLISPEPMPKPNNNPPMWDLALEQIVQHAKQRDEFGLKKYGTRLQPFNGRDPLVDGFQEIVDALVYSYQSQYEMKFKQPVVDAAIKWVQLYLDENASGEDLYAATENLAKATQNLRIVMGG